MKNCNTYKNMNSPENNRFIRCIMVVMKEFPNIMQCIMQNSAMSPDNLYNCIMKDSYFRKEKLNSNDMCSIQTLLSDGYTQLDFTLIFKIITHYNNLFVPQPTRGWGTCPNELELTIGDDTQRLRRERNKFVHMVKPEISENEFINFFAKMTDISHRIDEYLNLHGEDSFEHRIKRYQNDSIDENVATQVYTDLQQVECFEEYFVVDLGNKTFSFYRGKTMKEFMKDLSKLQSNDSTPITLYFPSVDSLEDVVGIVESVKKKMDHNSLKIKLKGAEYGSLILYLTIQNELLFDEQVLISEFTNFCKILNEEADVQTPETTVIVTVTDSKDNLFADQHFPSQSLQHKECHNEGPLLLKLEVENDSLQSEESLKQHMEHFLGNLVEEANGNQLFKQNALTAFVELGERENSEISQNNLEVPCIVHTTSSARNNEDALNAIISALTEKNRFLVLCNLVLEVLAPILRMYLQNASVKNPAKTIHKIAMSDAEESTQFRKQLNLCEIEMLDSLDATNSFDQCSIPFMYEIVRNRLFQIISDPPTKNWGSNPISTENSVGDDIERIRRTSIFVSHNTSGVISEKHFHKLFKDITRVVKRADFRFTKTGDLSLEQRVFNLVRSPEDVDFTEIFSEEIGRHKGHGKVMLQENSTREMHKN